MKINNIQSTQQSFGSFHLHLGVREALGKKQEEYIIGDRENGKNDEQIKQILKEKLIKLYKNREILKELSKENLESIEEYDGGKIIKEFENYFNECLK